MEVTVKSCTKKDKGWTNPEGKEVDIYKVVFTDSTEGEIMGKQIPVGTPISEVTVTPSTYGNKLKYNKPSGFGAKSKSGNESFALSYSKDWAIAQLNKGVEVKTDDILKIADKFFEWLENKKK